MESMERIDVLKGIEKILVEKAYETGHVSHRADGDWQKQADGSWTPYTGQSDQSTSQAQEPAPTESTEYGEITEEDLVETSDNIDYEKPIGKSSEWLQNYLSDFGYHPTEKDKNGRPTEYEDENWDTIYVTYDRLGYVTKIENEDDIVSSDETPKFDSDNEEKNFLKEEYNIDPATYKDSDVQAIRHDLSTTYGLNGDELEYVADLIIENLPEDDEPSDDEIYDYEDDLMAQKEAFRDYRQSHPYPALDNEGHSKGLTSERDMFFDAIERFQELTDPDEDEQLTPSEAFEQMKKEMEMGKDDPEIFTPAVKSGFEKFFNWASDFVGKSAIRDMRSVPTVKNMGF